MTIKKTGVFTEVHIDSRGLRPVFAGSVLQVFEALEAWLKSASANFWPKLCSVAGPHKLQPGSVIPGRPDTDWVQVDPVIICGLQAHRLLDAVVRQSFKNSNIDTSHGCLLRKYPWRQRLLDVFIMSELPEFDIVVTENCPAAISNFGPKEKEIRI